MSQEEETQKEEVKKAGEDDTIDLLDSAARKIAELKAENDRMEANIKEIKNIEARKLIGGMTDQSEPEKKEETPQEYKEKIEKGIL